MRIDHAGNVGIGTTDPGSILEVGGVAATLSGWGGASVNTIGVGGETSGRLYLQGSGQADIIFDDSGAAENDKLYQIVNIEQELTFRTITDAGAVGVNTMVLDKDGNVGIGITDPSGMLSIGTTNPTISLGTSIYSNPNALIGRAASANYHVTGTAEGDLAIRPEATAKLVFGTTPTSDTAGIARMTIDNAGNVGIGTASPVAALEISGTTGLTWAASGTPSLRSRALVNIGDAGTGGSLYINTPSLNSTYPSGLGINGSYSSTKSIINLKALGVYSGGYSSEMAFYTTNATTENERMRIDSLGNVGIGTTAPEATLHVDGGVCVTSDDACGTTVSDGEIAAEMILDTGADYAEFFYTDDTDLESGEVVCIDISNDNAVARCERESDTNIMGIVSSKPAIVGNSQRGYRDNPNYVIVGMLGQVPAYASNENGDIRSGDSLTSASIPGYVMKANAGDSTVGVALEGLVDEAGMINVLISRKNKSLTVSQVEDQIIDKIAAMEIEDEVDLLVGEAVNSLDLVQAIENQQIQIDTLGDAVQETLDISGLVIQVSDLEEEVAQLRLDIIKATGEYEDDQIDGELFEEVIPDVWEFTKQVAFNMTVVFKDTVHFMSDVVFTKEVLFEDRVTFADKDMAGFAVIRKDDKSVDVRFKDEYSNQPILSVLPEGQKVTHSIDNVSTKGFSIVLENSTDEDVKFHWTAIAISDAVTFESSSGEEAEEDVLEIDENEESVVLGAEDPVSEEPTNSDDEVVDVINNEEEVIESSQLVITESDLGFVRVRFEASVESEEITTVSPGDVFTYDRIEFGWYYIEYEEGEFGYISELYVELISS